MPRYAAIILAAGTGTRSESSIPKQYYKLNGRYIIDYSIKTFHDSGIFEDIIVVVNPKDKILYNKAVINTTIIFGAATRRESTLNALTYLKTIQPDFVYIHDAARPFVTINQIKALQENINKTKGAILALPVSDTIKLVENNKIVKTLNRAKLYAAQTPQAFPFQAIYNAHLAVQTDFTDDSAIAESVGLPITIVKGDSKNIKITWSSDFALAKHIGDN